MPILAIGPIERRSDAGFSLVEIVVAVTLVGLAVAAVMVTLPDASAALRADADRLAARLSHVAQSSVLDGVAMGARIDDTGYSFFRATDDGWRSIFEDPALVPVSWRGGISASVMSNDESNDAARGALAPNVVFDPTGVATPFTVGLGVGDAQISVRGDMFGTIRIGRDDAHQ